MLDAKEEEARRQHERVMEERRLQREVEARRVSEQVEAKMRRMAEVKRQEDTRAAEDERRAEEHRKVSTPCTPPLRPLRVPSLTRQPGARR